MALVLDLKRRGLTEDDAMSVYREWLEQSAVHGTSRDLLGADAKKLDALEKDGRQFFNSIRQPPAPALSPRPRSFVALSLVAGVLARSQAPHSFTNTPPAWNRASARSALSPQDAERLREVECDWLRAKLEVLIGLLRLAERRDGALKLVTISAAVLDHVLGGRPPPARLGNYQDEYGDQIGVRAALLLEASKLGYLSSCGA